MQTNSYTLLLAATALSFTACTDEGQSTLPIDGNPVSITTTLPSASTRADGVPYQPTAGKLTLYSTSVVDNKLKGTYVYADNQWNTEGVSLYWDALEGVQPKVDGASVDLVFPFFAVAPAPLDDVARSAVSTDQRAAATPGALSPYQQSDLLMAYTVATQRRINVSLEMKHLLAQTSIRLLSSGQDAFTPAELATATVQIAGAQTSYEVSYVPPKGSTFVVPSPDIPALATGQGEAALALFPLQELGASTPLFRLILPPQSIAEKGLTVVATIANNTYTWLNKDALELQMGKNLSISLNLTKSNIDLATDGITLTPWKEGTDLGKQDIKLDIIGTPDSPIAGSGAPFFTTMKLWKNTIETVLTYEKDATAWTLSSVDVAKGNSPFYLDDLSDADRFYATAENSAVDKVTALKDIVASGPAAVKGGQLNLEFRHLLAQLAVVLKTSADFPKEINIVGATITLPQMVQEYTLTGIDLAANTAKQGTYQPQPFTNGSTASLLVVPQTLAPNTKLVVTLSDKKTYTVTVPAQGWKLEASKKNTLTFTLSPIQPTTSLGVESWVTTNAGSEAVTIDGMGDAASGNSYTAATGDELQLVSGSQNSTYLYDAQKKSWNAVVPLYWDNFVANSTHNFFALVTPKGDAPAGGSMKDILYSSLTDIAFGAPLNFTNNNALKHAMSQFELTIKKGTGYADTEPFVIAGVQMKGVKSASAIANDGKGTPTLSATPAVITPVKTTGKLEYTVIVAPQPLIVGEALVTFTVNDKPFTVEVPAGFTSFTAGKLHQFTGTINKSGLSTIVSLVEWKSDKLGEGDIEVDE